MTLLTGGRASTTTRARAADGRVGADFGSARPTRPIGAEQSLAWARSLGLAVCLSVAYALGAWVTFWHRSAPGAAAAFSLPAGLALATLVLSPRRTWPLWAVAFAAANIGVVVAHHRPLPLALGLALANTVEPLVGALLVGSVRCSGPRARVLRFTVCPVIAAPLLGASIGATSAALFSSVTRSWWDMASTKWAGDALGVLVVGGAVLVWARAQLFDNRATAPAMAAQAVAAAGVVLLSGVVWHRPMLWAVLPLFVWAALTGGARAVGTVGAATAAAVDWAALSGRANRLLPGAHADVVLYLQVYLAVIIVTGMVLAAEVVERRRADAERLRSEQVAVEVAEAERRSISRETHDIVGHGLNALLLQLGAARQVLDRDPRQARDLLASAEAIGRGSCQDLDLALATLGGTPSRAPRRGLAELPDLVAALSKAGLRVTLRTSAEGATPPTLVDWSAYRIVQEALTNVAKHAPGARVTISVDVDDNRVDLSVVDDGGGSPGTVPVKGGRGIVGMRERAEALGGTLDATPKDGGGFAVVARLPW